MNLQALGPREVDDARDKAIAMAVTWGQSPLVYDTARSHWVIDQIVRILAGSEYDAIVSEVSGDDFEWDVGTDPRHPSSSFEA